KMAREAKYLVGEKYGSPAEGGICAPSRLPHMFIAIFSPSSPVPASPFAAGKGRGHIVGQAEDFPDFADRAFRAVSDDCRGQCRMVVAVTLINVLYDFLAPLMLEIHI